MIRETTSASNIKRRRLCPGSARMEEGLPETQSPDSEEGTKLHELYFTGKRPDWLTEEQAQALDCADRETGDFFALFAKQCGIPEDAVFISHHERTLEFKHEDVRFPGHADIIRVWPEHDACAIVDAKFGRLEVDDAQDNDQLASYASMVSRELGCFHTGVCITQPRNYGQRSTSAIYTGPQIAIAEMDIANVIIATRDPDAPLNPSVDACRYCKAKAGCEAYTGALTIPEAQGLTAKTAPDALALLDDHKLGAILDAVKFAAMIDKPAKAEARRRKEAGGMPDWELKPGNQPREVTDNLAAYALIKEQVPNLSDADYMAACKLSLGLLKKPVALALKIPQTQAERLINETLAPVIERGQNAPSIQRK